MQKNINFKKKKPLNSAFNFTGENSSEMQFKFIPPSLLCGGNRKENKISTI